MEHPFELCVIERRPARARNRYGQACRPGLSARLCDGRFSHGLAADREKRSPLRFRQVEGGELGIEQQGHAAIGAAERQRLLAVGRHEQRIVAGGKFDEGALLAAVSIVEVGPAAPLVGDGDAAFERDDDGVKPLPAEPDQHPARDHALPQQLDRQADAEHEQGDDQGERQQPMVELVEPQVGADRPQDRTPRWISTAPARSARARSGR